MISLVEDILASLFGLTIVFLLVGLWLSLKYRNELRDWLAEVSRDFVGERAATIEDPETLARKFQEFERAVDARFGRMLSRTLASKFRR